MELETLEPDPGNTGGGNPTESLYPLGLSLADFFILSDKRNGMMKQPEASIAIQVLPKTAASEGVIPIVDKVIAYLKSTGLKTFVGPFETTVEGDFDQLWEIAKECQLICIREGAGSVSAYLKTAYNPQEGVWSIEHKTAKHQG